MDYPFLHLLIFVFILRLFDLVRQQIADSDPISASYNSLFDKPKTPDLMFSREIFQSLDSANKRRN